MVTRAKSLTHQLLARVCENLALSAICIVACAVAIRYGPQNEPIATNLRLFLVTGAWLNLYLMIFNLMPVPPLDGSVILAGFSDGPMRFRRGVFTPSRW